MKARIILLAIVITLIASACGGASSSTAPVDGESLFNQTVLESQPGCVTCHSLEPGKVLVGPSLAGIGAEGEAFIRESITDPDKAITEGFPSGTMPKDYGKALSKDELDALVSFLATK